MGRTMMIYGWPNDFKPVLLQIQRFIQADSIVWVDDSLSLLFSLHNKPLHFQKSVNL